MGTQNVLISQILAEIFGWIGGWCVVGLTWRLIQKVETTDSIFGTSGSALKLYKKIKIYAIGTNRGREKKSKLTNIHLMEFYGKG
jgi:hypothetical protein